MEFGICIAAVTEVFRYQDTITLCMLNKCNEKQLLCRELASYGGTRKKIFSFRKEE